MDAREKRKRVMSRSMKLGHCVCDPRKPCPCPLFKEKNVCTCAGERTPPETSGEAIRLTKYVRSAGCASKIGQRDLDVVLGMLPRVEDARLVIGAATADDAAVYEIAPGILLVQTVDVFTPGVDEPRLFGRIAACNSMSDVYAMGGRPVTALSIIGFPIEHLPREAMAEIIRGGMDSLAEAGALLVGGHSINDEEVKFGLAVTGIVERAALVSNAGAGPGDLLVLTKPLGTGIVSLAHQIGRASREAIDAAAVSMTTLNRTASEVMVRRGARACTDVTGFGFLGHLCRMAIESRVAVEVWCDRLPLLPSVREYAGQGIYSGANERNQEFCMERTEFASDVAEETRAILFDAQTSGGLLIAFPADKAEDAVAEMRSGGVRDAEIVGRITGRSEGTIHVVSGMKGAAQNAGRAGKESVEMKEEARRAETECCAGHGTSSVAGAGGIGAFEDFLASALKPGAIDVVAKELIAVALGLAVHCVPCTRIHLKKARSMGIGEAELEEAAALAVAFSGCRAMMLWEELKLDGRGVKP